MKTLSIILGILIMTSLVASQSVSNTSDISITAQERKLAGITPDNPLWYVELFFDRIQEVREKSKLKNLRERLAESKIMLEEEKYTRYDRAVRKFERTYERVREKPDAVETKRSLDDVSNVARERRK